MVELITFTLKHKLYNRQKPVRRYI